MANEHDEGSEPKEEILSRFFVIRALAFVRFVFHISNNSRKDDEDDEMKNSFDSVMIYVNSPSPFSSISSAHLAFLLVPSSAV
jgi:hypothetical protein